MLVNRRVPVCPDCGYTLNGVRRGRCPECGVRNDRAAVGVSRWAMRRLPWEQQTGVRAFVITSLAIITAPWSVVRRVTIADRWWRAIAWALVNVCIAAAIGTPFAADRLIVSWVSEQIWPDQSVVNFIGAVPDWYVALRAYEIYLTLWAKFAVVPTIGIALAAFAGLHSSRWRSAALKYSLYVSTAVPVAVAAWHSYWWMFPDVCNTPSPLTVLAPKPDPEAAVWFVGVVYGVWWGGGVVTGRRRLGPGRARTRRLVVVDVRRAAMACVFIAIGLLFTWGCYPHDFFDYGCNYYWPDNPLWWDFWERPRPAPSPPPVATQPSG